MESCILTGLRFALIQGLLPVEFEKSFYGLSNFDFQWKTYSCLFMIIVQTYVKRTSPCSNIKFKVSKTSTSAKNKYYRHFITEHSPEGYFGTSCLFLKLCSFYCFHTSTASTGHCSTGIWNVVNQFNGAVAALCKSRGGTFKIPLFRNVTKQVPI